VARLEAVKADNAGHFFAADKAGYFEFGPASHQMMKPSTGRNRISKIHATFLPVLVPLLCTTLMIA
jgi:hypothetical protein